MSNNRFIPKFQLEILKGIILTFRKNKLNFEENILVKVKDKRMVKPPGSQMPAYFVDIISGDEKYAVRVNMNEYEKYKKGDHVRGSLLRHNSGVIILSLEEDGNEAIRKLVKRSRFELLFLCIALILTLFGFYIMFGRVIYSFFV